MSQDSLPVHERDPNNSIHLKPQHLRLGHALAGGHHQGALKRHMQKKVNSADSESLLRRADTKCLSGALYTAPLGGADVDTANTTSITWDKSCLPSGLDKIDIYLYAPQNPTSNLPIYMFQGLPAGRGHYETKLHPYLWNVTATQSSKTPLSLNIVPHGNEPWDTANPTGPIWNAVYTAPPPGQSPPSDATAPTGGSFKIIDAFFSGGGLTKGGMAAAIICPLVVVGVALGLWIRKLHINRNNKTVDWAEHMDKRMSRISLDWQAGGDGSAGPVPGSRPASYFARPSGTFTPGSQPRMSMAGAGMAGRGAMIHNQHQQQYNNGLDGDLTGGMNYDDGEDWGEDPYGGMEDDGEMRERVPRPRGPSMYSEGARQSRISFAQSTTGDRVSRISFAGQSSNDHSGQGPKSIASASNGGHKNSASIPRVGQNGNAWRRSGMTTESYYDPDAPAVPKLSGTYNNENNRTSRLSMAFTNNKDQTQDADEDEEDLDELGMSPTQHDGPTQLGRGEVDSKMRESFSDNRATTPGDDDADREFRASVLKYPALSFMQEGKVGSEGQEHDMFQSAVTSPQENSNVENGNNYINHGHYAAGAHALSPDHPARLAQLAANAGSSTIPSSHNLTSTPASSLPSLNSQTGMAPPSSATSPDEALKQYAALRANAASPPLAASNSQGMRTLYTPNSTTTSLNALDGNLSSNGHRQNQLSVAGSSLNEDDVVGYNEMIN